MCLYPLRFPLERSVVAPLDPRDPSDPTGERSSVSFIEQGCTTTWIMEAYVAARDLQIPRAFVSLDVYDQKGVRQHLLRRELSSPDPEHDFARCAKVIRVMAGIHASCYTLSVFKPQDDQTDTRIAAFVAIVAPALP